MKIPELSVAEVKERLADVKLVDVRRPDEFVGELGHIQHAVLATLETDLETFLANLPKDKPYIFVCRSGGRSGVATELAIKHGFLKVFNMVGGMIAWNQAGYDVER